RLPRASLVLYVFSEHSAKILSIRGSFVRLVELVSKDGIADLPPPVSARTGGVTLRNAPLSPLLAATADESQQVAAGNGLVHRLIPLSSPIAVPFSQWGRGTQSLVARGRDASFRLYENTLLGYLALASLEQLLRVWAER